MMKKNINLIIILFSLVAISMVGCVKYEKGFISPTIAYSITTFNVVKGRVGASNTLVPDGSSIPMEVKWTHIYDANGKIVDDIFRKTYPVAIWTEAYNPLTDKTFAQITAKRKVVEMPALIVNPINGSIEANPGSVYIPSGSYTIDLEVKNIAGIQQLKKAMTINFAEGNLIEITPGSGAFSFSRLNKNTGGAPPNSVFFNGVNNPFVKWSATRYLDTGNLVSITIRDRNGKIFNPKSGEVAKRPASGLNPNPPFLQNLEYYAPDTYFNTETSMNVKFPLVPFPIQSLGNGFNLYYVIPSAFVSMDSTAAWASNADTSLFYKGVNDSRYLGKHINDKYDYSVRIPLRIFVPGSYKIDITLLNADHR